jgi:hypothetical protein
VNRRDQFISMSRSLAVLAGLFVLASGAALSPMGARANVVDYTSGGAGRAPN